MGWRWGGGPDPRPVPGVGGGVETPPLPILCPVHPPYVQPWGQGEAPPVITRQPCSCLDSYGPRPTSRLTCFSSCWFSCCRAVTWAGKGSPPRNSGGGATHRVAETPAATAPRFPGGKCLKKWLLFSLLGFVKGPEKTGRCGAMEMT